MATILMFNPFAMSNINMDSSEERSYWRWQLRLCKVFPDTEMHNAITDIAALLASFFHGSDMVLSDVVAGLLLVAHSPHQKPPPESEDEPSNVIWMKLPESTHEIKRIFDFASAVYGWPIYLITHRGCIPWCRLCRNIIKCRKCRWDKELVIKDNCFMCNTAAFLLGTNTAKSDLVFVSFRNRLYQSPFIVLVDHKSSSIIIAIRGSFSFTDVFTDLMLSDATLGGSVDVDTDDVLFQDKSLDDDGENKRILENLFAKNPDYKLVITGHSLGAGVASLLTLLYKKTYSFIRCYAFSPPGCVISENGISDTEKHVLSIIIGDDVIPRTSYQSLLRLKLAIDREIHSTNLPKYKILAQGLYRLLLKKPCNFVSNKIPSYIQHKYRGIEAESTRVQIRKLLHLNPKEGKVIASFIKHEFIKDIQLTSSMLSDHMLMKVRKVLRKLDENNS
uniref:sn-1-specific diacylglycerol lipase n=1 Tax=Acrobeloides nanus TaxID=290746 RepID=A0A914CCH7_9BILA